MAKKAKGSDEYELMPIKPLHDLKKEIHQLRKEMQKEDKMHEVMVKILNSNIQTHRQVMETMYKLEDVRVSLNKFTRLIAEMGGDSEEGVDELGELNKKFKDLEASQEKIANMLNKIMDMINKREYFKFNMPRNVPIVYKRTR